MQHPYSFFSRKSLRSIVIVASCMMTSFAAGIQTAGDVHPLVDATEAGGTRIAGDINNDSVVDMLDARIILEIAREYRMPTADELAGDPNADMKLTTDDAIEILRRIETR